MSIAALMMSQQAIGMRYNSVGSSFSALNAKMGLANNTNSANMDLAFAQEKDLDSQLIQNNLQYKAADAMEDSSKKRIDDWAKSFNVFG